MTQNTTQTQPATQPPVPKKPNDTGSISVEGFVRIFDPKNKEVFVEKRA
jgi:hypothetical protein